jgi:hypothetical protein
LQSSKAWCPSFAALLCGSITHVGGTETHQFISFPLYFWTKCHVNINYTIEFLLWHYYDILMFV